MELEEVADRLLKLGAGVRVVSVCNMDGELVFHKRHRDVKNKLSKAESKASLVMAASQWKKRKELARKLGKCKYAMAEYADVKRITIPAGKSHLLYVTTSTDFDHRKILKKVASFS